jgi:hypothetical protein
MIDRQIPCGIRVLPQKSAANYAKEPLCLQDSHQKATITRRPGSSPGVVLPHHQLAK